MFISFSLSSTGLALIRRLGFSDYSLHMNGPRVEDSWKGRKSLVYLHVAKVFSCSLFIWSRVAMGHRVSGGQVSTGCLSSHKGVLGPLQGGFLLFCGDIAPHYCTVLDLGDPPGSSSNTLAFISKNTSHYLLTLMFSYFRCNLHSLLLCLFDHWRIQPFSPHQMWEWGHCLLVFCPHPHIPLFFLPRKAPRVVHFTCTCPTKNQSRLFLYSTSVS